MSKRIKILFLLLFVITLLPCALFAQNSFGLSIPKNKKYIAVPFELYNNLIVVKIQYNGFVNLNFILDTGVRSAILTDSKMAILLNPRFIRPIKIGGLGGDQEIDAIVATGLSFTMAGLTGKDQLMIILTEDVFSLSKFIGKEVHGILGYEIFNRFVVEIDYKLKMIRLYEPSKYNSKSKGQVFPISIEDTKPFIHGQVKIKDKTVPVKLIVDTGAGHALALYKGSHPDIDLPDTVLRSMLGRGLNGSIEGYYGRIKNFSLGKFKMTDILTSFPDSTEVGSSFRSNDRQGNLGGEILSRFKVTFNYHGNYMILQKRKGKEKPYYFNMSGIELVSKGDNLKTFEVDHVRENSPASMEGILPGDVIVELNGRSAEDYNLSEINTIFQSKPGRKIVMKISRGDQIIKKKIILQKII